MTCAKPRVEPPCPAAIPSTISPLRGSSRMPTSSWRATMGMIRSLAAVAAPVSRPGQDGTGPEHHAGYVPGCRRHAPCRRPSSPRIAIGHACHRRSFDEDMAFPRGSQRYAHDGDQRIAGLLCGRRGTGLIDPAAPIRFAGGDARDPQPGTLGAPDRAIAFPDTGGCALEGLSRRNHGVRDQQQGDHQLASTGRSQRSPMSTRASLDPSRRPIMLFLPRCPCRSMIDPN